MMKMCSENRIEKKAHNEMKTETKITKREKIIFCIGVAVFFLL